MVEIKNLKLGEEDKLVETMYTIFKDEKAIIDVDYFRKHIMAEENYSPSNVKVVVDNDKILSHVVIQEREMYIPNGTIKIGGVALVGTLKEHRRKGYATQLLNYAIEDMKSRDYDASILFTNNPYFRNSPWEPLKREFVISGLKKGKLKTSTLNPDDIKKTTNIIDLLKKKYNSFSKNKKFLLKRSKSYLENRLSNDFLFSKDNFFLFFCNLDFVGYAIYEDKNSIIEIKEAIYKDDYLDDIIIKASQIAENKNIKKIGMFGPYLKNYDVLDIINKKDGKFYRENLMMLPLKENIELPKDPILFWPADHF